MSTYLYIILAYLLVLTFFNFYRARQVKSQEDFMVAGRRLKTSVMVFTLICTWIGSGTFIAGAEFASKAGFSALWLPAGAWVGIILIYFLAGKIRTFGQYTIGDILEKRFGPAARIFGAIAIIISFTVIVSYQFVAGGFILNVVTDGAISDSAGTTIAALFVILFTALGGMVAVAYTDLPNGIIILLACLLAVPFVYFAAGGLPQATETLDPGYFSVINKELGAFPKHEKIWGFMLNIKGYYVINNQFGPFTKDFFSPAYTNFLMSVRPILKAIGYFLATLLLLLGVQSMYQKFYSARTPKDAKKAVILWTIGTVFVETVVVVIAVFAYSKLKDQIDLSIPKEGGKVVLMAAKSLIPAPVGILLLAAACAVVISTGMNYLLSPSTNIIHDIYQRFIKRDPQKGTKVPFIIVYIVFLGALAFFLAKIFAFFLTKHFIKSGAQLNVTVVFLIVYAVILGSLAFFLVKRFSENNSEQSSIVALQIIFVIILGILAFFLATKMTSVLSMAFFAYTIYGVAITPALIAALVWKRVTKAAGVASIISGTCICVFLRIIAIILGPGKAPDGDPWGIPLIYPALAVSLLTLVVVSFLTKKPTPEEIEKFFPSRK